MYSKEILLLKSPAIFQGEALSLRNKDKTGKKKKSETSLLQRGVHLEATGSHFDFNSRLLAA